MLTAKDIGQVERLDGLRGDWYLIGLMGGPPPDKLAKLNRREYQQWEFPLRKELAERPPVTVDETGAIEMTLTSDGEVDEWRLRPGLMRDNDDAARYGRSSQYRASRHLICLLAGDKMLEDVDALPAGAYFALIEAIGAGF